MSLHTEMLDTPNGPVLMIQSNNYIEARFDGDPSKHMLCGAMVLSIRKTSEGELKVDVPAVAGTFDGNVGLHGDPFLQKLSKVLHSVAIVMDKAVEMLNKGMPVEE